MKLNSFLFVEEKQKEEVYNYCNSLGCSNIPHSYHLGCYKNRLTLPREVTTNSLHTTIPMSNSEETALSRIT